MATAMTLCPLCERSVSPFQFVKVKGETFHVDCYVKREVQAALEQEHLAALEKAEDLRRVEEDRKAEAAEKERAALQHLFAKGKERWTREDRQKLVEAHLICVHCSKTFTWGDPASGPERKHCRSCYMASQYGEKEAAAASSKSAAGIAKVEEVLKGAAPAAEPKKEEPKKDEEHKDRFELIDI